MAKKRRASQLSFSARSMMRLLELVGVLLLSGGLACPRVCGSTADDSVDIFARYETAIMEMVDMDGGVEASCGLDSAFPCATQWWR